MPKPNTADAMKRHKAGKAGFTDKAHLKAKGLIPRADGTKKKSPKYEDAPANATGTAVAGTGDDSSTVVMKKKRKDDMRDRLLKRFKIKETIDRQIPDLEYSKDEITERKNQLKAMALKIPSINVNDKSNIQVNPVEDLDAQPQDKDVKKVKGTQPKKYYKTLDKDTKKKRAAFFKKKGGTYKKSDDNDDYKAAPGDKKAKTKQSTFTTKYKKMYGESTLDQHLDEEQIKGLVNKAKKTGMPYSILKQVYNRGMAAWKGGHRPGASQQQWAFARVNSFVTKSSGTWGGADKDLAKKVRGSK